jgi:hypothetical protein
MTYPFQRTARRRLFVATFAALLSARAVGGQTTPASLSADSTELLRNALLAPAATQADLDVVDQAFRSLHPAVYRYSTPAQWSARVDSLRVYFAVPRTRGDTYLAFARLTASIQCGHTYLNFWNQPRSVRRWLTDGADKLPFEFDLSDRDTWTVTRSGNAALRAGDVVQAINGVRTADIVDRLLPYVRGDGADNGKRRALLDFRHHKEYETIDVLLPLMLPPLSGTYAVTVRHARATRDTIVRVAAIPAAIRRRGALPVPTPRSWREFSRDGDVAVLRVDQFDYGSEAGQWQSFVTQTFQSLKNSPTRALIVDIRENEGGSDEGAAFLLRHLIRAPITLPPLRRFVAYDTVATALRPLLNTWDDGFFDRRGTVTRERDGTFTLNDRGDWPAQLVPAPDAFAGRIFVLTSYVNSSASHIMLRLLARQPGVTLVGDPSGGSLRAHTGGNLFFLKLANTGMEVDVPLIAYDWGANNPSGGVQPDIRVPANKAYDAARRAAVGASPRR